MSEDDYAEYFAVVLSPEEFDRVMADLMDTAEPTESIKRAAKLLEELYGSKPA